MIILKFIMCNYTESTTNGCDCDPALIYNVCDRICENPACQKWFAMYLWILLLAQVIKL